jgi:hypothetical protein
MSNRELDQFTAHLIDASDVDNNKMY